MSDYDRTMPDPRIPVDIEARIIQTADALEETTDIYRAATHAAAIAEATWKGDRARSYIAVADSGLKLTAGERDSRADRAVEDQFRAHMIAAAHADATRQALYSLRARIDALRTLAANVRAQTG